MVADWAKFDITTARDVKANSALYWFERIGDAKNFDFSSSDDAGYCGQCG